MLKEGFTIIVSKYSKKAHFYIYIVNNELLLFNDCFFKIATFTLKKIKNNQ